jgi:hypothetical protein
VFERAFACAPHDAQGRIAAAAQRHLHNIAAREAHALGHAVVERAFQRPRNHDADDVAFHRLGGNFCFGFKRHAVWSARLRSEGQYL